MQNHKILWTFGSKYSRGSTLFIIKNRRQSRVIASFSALVLFALTYAIFNPIYVEHDGAYAVTGSATAATTSLTLSSSNNSANVAITPKSANGTFAMSSTAGEAQFGVTTNNFTGYELSIVADDDSGNLTNTNGNVEHSIFSIDAPMTKDSFDTITYNNRWGYKPSKYVSNNVVIDNTGDSAMFLPSPTTTGTVLDHTTVANSSANNYSIALGVRADYNTYSGSYAKAFKLQVTANPASYTINFNKNTADAVANMPTAQSSASVSATSITLANNTPERAHYTFLGWCSTATTASNGVDSCSGTTYQPNGAYGIDQTTANITTLYAMWKINSHTLTITKDGYIDTVSGAGMHNYGEVVTIVANPSQGNEFVSWTQTAGNTISFANAASATTTFVMPDSNVTINASGKVSVITFAQAFANAGKAQTSGYYSMQDMSPSICSAVTTGQTASLRDTRDGEIYTVGKLADNRCWLLDNLRLDIVNTSLDALKGKTNASDVALEYLKGVRVDNFYGRYAQSGVFDLDQSTLESVYHLWSRPVISAAYKDVVPSSGYQGKAGVYYSSCAALAGAFCSENWAFFTLVDQYIDNKAVFSGITEDVCPKGWRMPTGGSGGEYQALYAAYSSDDINFMNALHTPFSGVINTSISSPGGVNYLNQNGKFWSATNTSTYFNNNSFMALEVYVAPRVNLTQSNNGMISMRCIIPESGSVANFSYNIQYDKNTTSAVTNMPANQSGSTEFKNSGIAVANNTPSRSGYRFIGWCNTRPTTMNGIDYCSSDTFAPNDIYEIGARTSVNVTFYAMWFSVSSAIAMQDVTISQCSTSPMLVYDNRDYEVYTIQKLADNKCWLLDNLRLDLSSIQKLTPANTNISSDWTVPAEINTRAWDGDRSKARIFADAKLLLQSYGSGNSRDGVYYSFCAASAGTYCRSVSNPPTDISYDICPKGWRIPTGKPNDGEYKALYTAYSSDGATFANAFRAIGSGSFSNGGISSFVSNQGGVGFFWSSSLGNYTDNYHRYALLANSSGSNIQFTARDNSIGASVRCVLK